MGSPNLYRAPKFAPPPIQETPIQPEPEQYQLNTLPEEPYANRVHYIIDSATPMPPAGRQKQNSNSPGQRRHYERS